jgi:hypothetical protein
VRYEELLLRQHALDSCRLWARIRHRVLDATAGQLSNDSDVEEFDKQMFRLGEHVYGPGGGEVAEVRKQA